MREYICLPRNGIQASASCQYWSCLLIWMWNERRRMTLFWYLVDWVTTFHIYICVCLYILRMSVYNNQPAPSYTHTHTHTHTRLSFFLDRSSWMCRVYSHPPNVNLHAQAIILIGSWCVFDPMVALNAHIPKVFPIIQTLPHAHFCL